MISIVSWVLDHSEERLGNRLVLIVLAEYAHEDGSKAFPSMESIVRRTRLSERQARNCLRSLESSGAIIRTGRTKDGVNVYRVVMAGLPVTGGNPRPEGGQSTTAGASRIAPDPPKEPSSSSSRNGRAPTQIGGKKVTSAEAQFADEALAAFNDVSGRSFASKETLGKIILRHREHPELDVAAHRALIEEQFASPWWRGEPSPAVIYGNGEVFDRALNGVRGRGGGRVMVGTRQAVYDDDRSPAEQRAAAEREDAEIAAETAAAAPARRERQRLREERAARGEFEV